MLARVAESIYWMSRYVERAENVATSCWTCRLAPRGWQPLVATTGDAEEFEKIARHGHPTT
jgi:uncharacterized alpha-E superfamily protein